MIIVVSSIWYHSLEVDAALPQGLETLYEHKLVARRDLVGEMDMNNYVLVFETHFKIWCHGCTTFTFWLLICTDFLL